MQRRPVIRLAIALAVISGFGALLKWKFFPWPVIDGDTTLLVGGVAQLHNCLASGHKLCDGVWHYPLLQYVEGLALLRTGTRADGIMHFYSHASAVAFIGTLLLGAAFLWRRGLRAAAAYFPVALLASFALWHINGTYGETAAAFITTGFVAAVWWRRSAVLIAVLAMLVAVTKETAAPFVLTVGVLPLLKAEGAWRARLRADVRHLVGLVVGIGCGVLANGMFNRFRFGAFTNTYLLDPILQVPSLKQHAIFATGLWLSPNGGLLVFAPLLVVPLIALAIAGWRSKTWEQRALSAAPLGLMVVLTIGFGRWFSPWGWWTWGPRLCIPWLGPLLLCALIVDGERFEAGLRRVLRPVPVAVVLALVVVAIGAPHLTMLPDSDAFYGFFVGNLECPRARFLDVRSAGQEFYDCLNVMVYPKQDFAIARTLKHAGAVWLQLALYALVMVGLCTWLRYEAMSPLTDSGPRAEG